MLSSEDSHGLSSLRLWVMRIPYFLTGILFTITAWSSLINYWGEFEPVEGVAYAFWGALSALAIIGLRFPVKMLPILLLQFFYKLIWVVVVGLPLYLQGTLDESGQGLMKANLMGVIIDLIAIPWLYSLRVFVIDVFRFSRSATDA
jgi:hypothetical protein